MTNGCCPITLFFVFSALRCVLIPYLPDVSTYTYNCKGMEGRYLNIVIPGKEEQLYLCEVEVTGQPADSSALPGDLNLIF